MAMNSRDILACGQEQMCSFAKRLVLRSRQDVKKGKGGLPKKGSIQIVLRGWIANSSHAISTPVNLSFANANVVNIPFTVSCLRDAILERSNTRLTKSAARQV
jgi:hypothetical protein